MDVIMKSCEIFKDIDGKFYLKLVYEYAAPDGTHEVVFPKVSLPLSSDIVPVVNTDNERLCYINLEGRVYINCKDKMLLFKQPIDGVDGEYYYIDRIVKPAIHKMTIEEIEKQLGYKVEIVSNKK